jgi:hypothetical protein
MDAFCPTGTRRFPTLTILACLALALFPSTAHAHVGSGANCAGCHSSARNAMSLTGFQLTTNVSAGSLKVYVVAPGETVPIGIQVTDGRNEYGFAMVGLDASGTLDSSHKLLSQPDASWTRRSAYYSLGPKTGNQSWTFRLGVPANTPPDLYLLSLRIAGDGGGRWNEQESFMVSVQRATPPQPQVTEPTRTGTTFACRVTTTTGFTYFLETQREPGVSPWTTVASTAGDGTNRTLTDPDATAPHAIYRVRVE